MVVREILSRSAASCLVRMFFELYCVFMLASYAYRRVVSSIKAGRCLTGASAGLILVLIQCLARLPGSGTIHAAAAVISSTIAPATVGSISTAGRNRSNAHTSTIDPAPAVVPVLTVFDGALILSDPLYV